MERRKFILISGAAAAGLTAGGSAFAQKNMEDLFGLIGRMIAVPGKRNELIRILLDGVSEMPGCLSYVIAKDTKDPNALWITEVWESEAHHKASLSLPAVKKSIAAGRPLIASFDSYTTTAPVGGHGLTLKKAAK